MKAAGMVTIILATAGLMLWASLSTAEQPTAGGTASIEKETSAGSGSSGTATQRGKAKKKRRSSGKQITEETTTGEKSQPGSGPAQGSEGGSSSTRSDIGSGGAGVTGATGR